MISDKHKFIFIHIDKNGGTSVTKYLAPVINEQVEYTPGDDYFKDTGIDKENRGNIIFNGEQINLNGKHMRAAELASRFPEKYREYTKFAIIRNSWDRALSMFIFFSGAWTFVNDVERIKHSPEFTKFLRNETFTDFIKGENKRIIPGSQTSYLQLGHGIDQSICLINFEKIDKAVPALAKRLGITEVEGLEFPMMNQTRNSHYSKYYTEDNIAAVSELFKDDIRNFGQNFEEK